jgi:predicted aspartyl protease
MNFVKSLSVGADGRNECPGGGSLDMGKVIQRIRVTNLLDPTRSKEIESVVDTGATMLVLPADVIAELGLRKVRDVSVRYANNVKQSKAIYGVVTLEMLGRSGNFDVLEEEPGAKALVGQIVLEELDFVVDCKSRGVMPNPESPDVPLLEIL